MKYLLILLLSLLSFILTVNAQNIDKIIQSKANGNIYPKDIKTDSKNNIVVCGNFWANDFQIDSLKLSTKGNLDIFLVKLDNKGNVIWGKSFGDQQEDNVTSLYIDKDDNIIITGSYFGDMIAFDNKYLYKTRDSWESDAYIAKFNSDGKLLWAFSFGNVNKEFGSQIIGDTEGNCYLFLMYNSTELNIGGNNLTNTGDSNLAIIKLNKSGKVLWANTTKGNSSIEINATNIDINNNIYFVGSFGKDSFNYENTSLVSNGFRDIFILKIDVDGNVINSKSIGSKYNDYPRDIAIDSNKIIITGGFSDTLKVKDKSVEEKGGDDAFVLTIDDDSFEVIDLLRFGNIEEDYGQSILKIGLDLFISLNYKSKFLEINKKITNTNENGWTYDAAFTSIKNKKFSPITIGGTQNESIIKTIKNNQNQIIILGLTDSEKLNIQQRVIIENSIINKNNMFLLIGRLN